MLWEQVLEDLLVGGFGAVEMEATGDAVRPLQLWPVDGATIQVDPQLERGSGERAVCAGDGTAGQGSGGAAAG